MWSPVETSSEAGQAPCARCKHAAALAHGYVYVLAGRGAGGALPLKDFWRYHLASGVWERLQCEGEPPPSLQQHTMTSHGNSLYVFGGEAGALSVETPLWVLNTETLVWKKLPGQVSHPSNRRSARGAGRAGGTGGPGGAVGPRGRRGHSAHALNDCLLIYGGYMDLKGSTNELWAFHYESCSWALVGGGAARGPARHRHAAALLADTLYVHAGQCDLRDCSDLWTYHTISRTWSVVRTPPRLSPAARSGHAAVRAGGHLYIFGGEVAGQPTNELWRFHFASESWERVQQTLQWPSPRVDACALLVTCPTRAPHVPRATGGAGDAGDAARAERPTSLLHEISKLSSFNIRRNNRCSYSMLAPDVDSTESLVRAEAAAPMCKSQSAYLLARRGPGPREAALPPADLVPAACPADHAQLVFLDSDDEEPARRTRRAGAVAALPKSASVRFTRGSEDDDADLSTSDYASAERVGRGAGGAGHAGAAGALGFSNPHYGGPDVRRLGAALTPDSGLAAADIPLQELAPRPARPPAALHALLLGGKEGAHVARLQAPLSLWTYRLL